jgi:hypothetical protein
MLGPPVFQTEMVNNNRVSRRKVTEGSRVLQDFAEWGTVSKTLLIVRGLTASKVKLFMNSTNAFSALLIPSVALLSALLIYCNSNILEGSYSWFTYYLHIYNSEFFLTLLFRFRRFHLAISADTLHKRNNKRKEKRKEHKNIFLCKYCETCMLHTGIL